MKGPISNHSNEAKVELYDAFATHGINSRELLGEVHHERDSQLLPVHRGADLGEDKEKDVLAHLGP